MTEPSGYSRTYPGLKDQVAQDRQESIQIDRLLNRPHLDTFLKTPGKRGSALQRQISQVSACATLLAPKGKPISDPVEEDLLWPDRTMPVKGLYCRET